MEQKHVISNLKEEEFNMAASAKVVVIADLHGRVLAAQLPVTVKSESKERPPDSRIVPLEGRRAVSFGVPREVLSLAGPELHRYFSEVQIGCGAEVQLPKIKIVRMHKE
jgi:hypothetical protein